MDGATWLSQVKRGLLELCILNLLAKESMYGYQLAKTLRQVPGLVVTEGTLYPLISRLKREKMLKTTLVESPHGPVRKTYTLSSAGEQRRSELNDLWKTISGSINKLID